MNYLYEAIKPTRLYIKQCPHCGLKYFGKHTGQDIEKYTGGGKYWNNHLNYHKVKPIHLWNSDWYYETSIKRFALKFSYINKIVESNKCANLRPEDGLEGGWEYVNNNANIRNGFEKTIDEIKKSAEFAEWSKKGGISLSEKCKNDKIFRKKLSTKISNSVKKWQKNNGNPFQGKTHSEETKVLIGSKSSEHQKGKGNSQYGTMWITDGTVNKKLKKICQYQKGGIKAEKFNSNMGPRLTVPMIRAKVVNHCRPYISTPSHFAFP